MEKCEVNGMISCKKSVEKKNSFSWEGATRLYRFRYNVQQQEQISLLVNPVLILGLGIQVSSHCMSRCFESRD